MRFLSLYEGGAKRVFSSDSPFYNAGITYLQESVKENTINKRSIRKANESFALAVNDSRSTCKLLSYWNIVCLYVLDQVMAISPIVSVVRILHPIVDIPIPTKISAKGLLENTVKGIGMAVGVAISFVPPAKGQGIALTKYCQNMQTSDAILDAKSCNEVFYKLREEITSIDYERYYRMLR